MSLSEMSRIYHVSSGALTNYLKKAGITMKKAIPRNQTGSNNGNWKGDNAGYSAFHYRVEKIRGKPKK